MKFKIGDRVRLTREGIKEIYGIWTDHNPVLIQGGVIEKIVDNLLSIDGNKKLIHEDHFELVHKESEFEYGEMVEVYSHADKSWEKRIFISKIPGNVGSPYACVNILTEDDYKKGKTFDVTLWENVRKLKNQLTRKEIAEKFGVNEDFTLID